ncbi:MAG TPA: tail-specific protease, partial [Bacteroidia bacterium]|nr:tail-specific protease [Bacteroidia bacterium]
MRYTKIAFFAVVLSVLGLFAFRTVNQEQAKDEVIMKLIVQGINSSHYAPFEIDDAFSKNVFNLYIDRLDYSKRYFTQGDIEGLRSYESKIDDQIKEGNYGFFDKSDEIYATRLAMVKGFYKEILTQPFDFSVDESIELDADEMAWAKDEKELKERWRKLLKYNVLSRLYTELDLQEKSESNPAGATNKSMAELEQDARAKVMKTYDDWAKRMDKVDEEDRRSMFLNVITNIFDPHTGY